MTAEERHIHLAVAGGEEWRELHSLAFRLLSALMAGPEAGPERYKAEFTKIVNEELSTEPRRLLSLVDVLAQFSVIAVSVAARGLEDEDSEDVSDEEFRRLQAEVMDQIEIAIEDFLREQGQ